jgi:hypothetical protein
MAGIGRSGDETGICLNAAVAEAETKTINLTHSAMVAVTPAPF